MECSRPSPPEIETLEPRLLLSGTGTFTDLARSATALSLAPTASVVANGHLTRRELGDLYSFASQAGGNVRIRMRAASGTLRPLVKVFSAAGRQIGISELPSRRQTTFRASLRVASDQEYYVLACGNSRTAGGYVLKLASRPVDDHGNVYADATPMALPAGEVGRTRGRINYAGDVDMLKVVAARSGVLEAAMRPVGATELNAELSVLDSAGERAPQIEVGAGGEDTASAYVVAGQVYYIQADGALGDVYRVVAKITQQDPPPQSRAAGRPGAARRAGRPGAHRRAEPRLLDPGRDRSGPRGGDVAGDRNGSG